MFIDIRQTIVEGIIERSRIPLTFSCYGAKLNGIVIVIVVLLLIWKA